MGASGSKKAVQPKEKHAFSIGIREYQVAEQKKHPNYRSLTNPAQNAFQMAKFFRKQGYDTVQSNVKEFDDVTHKRAKAVYAQDIMPILDDFLVRAHASKKQTKRNIHFFIYYSGIVIQANDTEEFCGLDSNGDLIPLERYCEALAAYQNVFTVCYIEGVYIKDPKRDPLEYTSKNQGSLLMQHNPRPSRAMSMSSSKMSERKSNS
jgi:hypothetical protein